LKAVLTWGIANRHTWLKGQKEDKRGDGKPLRPLPFDQNRQQAGAFMRSVMLSTLALDEVAYC
jgi:GH35 family endo-1,4-beta-xylanase